MYTLTEMVLACGLTAALCYAYYGLGCLASWLGKRNAAKWWKREMEKKDAADQTSIIEWFCKIGK